MVRIQKISLLFVLLLVTAFVHAQTEVDDVFEDGGVFYKIIDGNTVEVCAVPNDGIYSENISIQPTVENGELQYNVIGIGANAFKSATFTSVSIPASVKTIGASAFYEAKQLQSVTFEDNEEDNVTTIANDAFHKCTSLTEITLPETLESIGIGAFRDCTSLTSITIPESTTTLGGQIFKGCTSLETIIIKASLGALPYDLLANCSGLITVTINNIDELETIGTSTFEGCEKLTSFPFAESGLVTISNNAFKGCGFTTIKLPGSIQTLGNNAFQGCTSLTELTLAEGFSSSLEIGQYTFKGCTNLTSFPFEKSKLVTIPQSAFEGCGFTTLTLPTTITSIGLNAFKNCNNLNDLTIPAGVSELTIGANAFSSSNGSLKFIYSDADAVPTAQDNSFAGNAPKLYCKGNLRDDYLIRSPWSGFNPEAIVNSTIKYFKDTSLYQESDPIRAGTTLQLIALPEESGWTSHGWFVKNEQGEFENAPEVMPATNLDLYCYYTRTYAVDVLKYSLRSDTKKATILADETNKNLTGTLTIPSSISYNSNAYEIIAIEDEAFKKAVGLTVVIFSGDTNLTNIGKGIFEGCSALASVTLPNTLIEISDNMFYNCTELSGITIPASVTKIGKSAFSRSGIVEITLPEHITVMGDSVFKLCDNLEKVTFAKAMNLETKTLPAYTFYKCEKLDTFALPTLMETIGQYAFQYCTGLTKVVLDQNISIVSPYAFHNCTNLKEITLPSTITQLGLNAFTVCRNVEKITIKSATAPSASDDGDGTFSTNILSEAYLYVDKVSAYNENQPTWGRFVKDKHIYPIVPEAITIPVNGITLSDKSSFDYTYDGSAKTPGVTVKVGGTTIPAEEYTVSYSNNTNAGKNAKVTITDKDGGYYSFASVDKTFEITQAKRKLEVLLTSHPQPKDIIYNKGSQNLINAGSINTSFSSTGLKLQYSLDKKTFDTTIPTGIDAKEYTVYYRVAGDPNYAPSDTASLKVTIKARSTDVTNISLSQSSYTYDGTAKKPTVTSVTIAYDSNPINSNDYTVSYQDSINAGTAKVVVTSKKGCNYSFSGSKTFEIKPAKGKLSELLTETGKPTAISDLTYTGGGQDLIKAGTIDEAKSKNGKLKYSLNGIDFDIAIPQGKDAKEYTVYYKVEDDPNYIPSDTASFVVTIKAKEVTISKDNITLEKDSYTYDGTAKKPVVTIKVGETTIPAEECIVSYTDSINAGTATVTITEKAGGNYKFKSVSKTYKITPAAGKLAELLATNPQSAGDNIIYNRASQYLIKAGTVNEERSKNGQLKYSLDKTNFTDDITKIFGTDAKEYTIYYMVAGDPNYTPSDTLSLKVTIKARSVSVTNISLSQNSYTYDGKAKEPTVTSVTVNYDNTVIGPKEYKVSYTNNVNATNKDSKAQVIITDSLGGNYSFDSKSTTFEIKPAKGKLSDLLTQKPTGIDKLSYTGAAQNLITAGTIDEAKSKNGKLKYSLDNKVFDTAIPQGIEAQDYTVYYKVEDDPNYLASDTLSLTITINAKKLSLSADNITLEKDSYIYDGTAKKPGVTVKADETTIPADEYAVSYADSINAGTATVTVTAKNGSNYDFTSVSKTYKITPKAGSMAEFIDKEPQPAGDNILYNTAPQNLIKAGTGTLKKGISGSLKYFVEDKAALATTNPQGTEAKEYTVYYMVEGDPNYTPSDTLSLKVTIKARPTEVSNITLESNSYIYDGTAKKPAVTSVKVKYNNLSIDPKEYTVSYQDSVNAGTATVIITGKAGGNYSFDSKSTTFEIKPAKGKLDNLLTQKPTAISDLIYTGEAKNLIKAGIIDEAKSKNGKLKYSLDNKEFSTAIPQGIKAQDYTVYYKVEDDPNYTPSDTLSLTVPISAKKISLSADNISLEKDSYTYDGTAKKPGVTVKTGGVTIPADEYIVSYKDNTNAGTATVTVTEKNGSNYSFESVRKTFKITPAASSLSQIPTGRTLTYNGTAQELLNKDGKASTGTLEYSLSKDEKTFKEAIPTGTDAKTYTVYYRVKGDNNHSDSEIGSVKATIAARDVNAFSLSQSSYTYNGGEIKPDVTVTWNQITVPGSEYTVSYSDNKNAGTATVTLADKEGGNFTVSGSKTFTITQAPLTISAESYEIFEGEKIPDFTAKYNGFVKNETQAVLTSKPIFSCNATATSKPGDYTISVGGAKAANYNITHKSGKLTILAMKFVSGGESSKDEDDPATYQIISTGNDTGKTPTVAITDDKEVGGAFAIPETVTYHNKNFTVTEINESAFENNKYLTEVSIPSSITSIGDKAFKGCSNLKSITVYITTPISLAVAGTRGEETSSDGTSVFDGVDKTTCILYVPEASVDLYKEAPVWKDFQNILPISTLTGISGVNVTEGEPFDVYNLQGRKVKSKATDLRGLPRGIYIINGKKVAVK